MAATRDCIHEGIHDNVDPSSLDWMSRGKCLPYPDFTESSVSRQKAICKSCPVTAECLDYILPYEEILPGGAQIEGYPVYGGMSVQERRTIRQRKAALRKSLESL